MLSLQFAIVLLSLFQSAIVLSSRRRRKDKQIISICEAAGRIRMPAVYQDSLFKVGGNMQLVEELPHCLFWAHIQVEFFLARGRVFGQISEEMYMNEHTVQGRAGASRVSRDLMPLRLQCLIRTQ